MQLNDSVNKIPYVKDATEQRLNALGIFSVKDLITYFPKVCEDRRDVRPICDLMEGEVNTFSGTVVSSPTTVTAGRYKITRFNVSDETGKCEIVWFNQPYMTKNFHVGDEFVFVGKIKKIGSRVQCTTPQYEKGNKANKLLTGKIVPKYGLTYKLSQKVLIGLINRTLKLVQNELENDPIPKEILKEYDLCTYKYAINNIHFPQDDDAYMKARRRLVFEEFFTTQLALTMIKNKVKKEEHGIKFKNVDLTDVLELLPYDLTNAQKRVLDEIKEDMHSISPMNRLVQGDVGSGKTVCAFLSMMIAFRNNYQAALMAPTEILATQHYEYFSSFSNKLGFKVKLLTGSCKLSEKREIYEELKNGDIDFIIGTHALVQDDVEFKNLGLVITDEQHRFGVDQRMYLSKKGDSPDVLVMTATPIPRTLGLILYGDLDISVIDELPKGRKPIDTLVVNTSYYERMYKFVGEEIDKGRQVYIICPMVEESEKEGMTELNAVTTYTDMIKERYLSNYNVTFVHGKMKAKEKQQVMDDFMNGKIDVLVSTTVVEVGINNPNASIMIIENAERFGLSQLHQLRGRVGRGEYKSYCILVSDSKTAISKKRLNTIKSTNDGFVVAEKDLELRGPGDFFGTKQHGIPDFKIANLYEDTSILKEAQKAVKEILDVDFLLEKEENRKLKDEALNALKYEVL